MDLSPLLLPVGVEVVAAVWADLRDDLAVSADLRRQYPADVVTLALQQRALRQRARGKLVDPGSWLLTREGLEQATATAVSQHRAKKFVGLDTVVDVCCGIGGDSRELARVVPTTVGIDRDSTHLAFARHNATISPVLADAGRLPLVAGSPVDAILVDPARRAGGARRRGHAESSPPLATCVAWSESFTRVSIKFAPGLDLDEVPAGWSVETVAVGRELKELNLWSPAWQLPARTATVLRTDAAGSTLTVDSLDGTRGETLRDGARAGNSRLAISAVKRFLYDPNGAITRAGLVEDLGERLGATMVDPRIAFLTSDEARISPFARRLEVLDDLAWSLKPVKARLRALGIGRVEIRQRGLTVGDTDSLRRRLANDSGPGLGVLVLTRIEERPWAIIAREMSD